MPINTGMDAIREGLANEHIKNARREWAFNADLAAKKRVKTSATSEKDTGARFSACGKYRYELWRKWDEGDAWCVFCMLNPSTADEIVNDPTVERCERRAREWGYDGLAVVNIFAWRDTEPAGMKLALDPVGPENDAAITKWAKQSALFVCAWGVHGSHLKRSTKVRALLSDIGVEAHVLKLTLGGEAGHPLYVPFSLKPKPWIL